MNEIFCEELFLSNKHRNHFKLTKQEVDDSVTFADFVGHKCKRFHRQSLTEVKFKWRIFITGLQTHCDADICSQLQSKREQQKYINVKYITTEFLIKLLVHENSRLF